MILDIEDYNGIRLCALDINPYDENIMTPSIENSIGSVSFCDVDELDDIFGTNDFKMRIQLDSVNNRYDIADKIIDDIVSSRKGELYDEEILQMYVDYYFADEVEKIKEIIDEKIGEFLEDDNLTIKR